jgi:hypothetical protein
MERMFEKIGRYFDSGWRLAVLDEKRGRWVIDPAVERIGYLRAENANGRHILMQPADETHYLLADDLTWDLLCSHHKDVQGAWRPGRMVVETSPGNFQVWIHATNPLSLSQKRFWLRRLLSDPGADPNNRWGRCPGFRNRKEKHRTPTGQYPLARLLWIDWLQRADIPPVPCKGPSTLSHQPPRGSVCHRRKIHRSDYARDDPSTTDFAYALALARRGETDEVIRSRILSERTCWKHHQGERRIQAYLDRTIRRARAIVGKPQEHHITSKNMSA